MQPDAQTLMRRALALGPDHCPPELFAGSVDRIVLGLKAHANTISHARFVALEETYPRLRERIGAENFHAVAERHLTAAQVLGRSLDLLGQGLPTLLSDPAARDLARIEWAWLESYHAPDAPALAVDEVLAMTPEALAALPVLLHPAARMVSHDSDGGATLLTRPCTDVLVNGITAEDAALLETVATPRPLGDLLAATDPAAVLAMLSAGAFAHAGDRP